MIDKEKFYSEYDNVMPGLCKPYGDFFKVGAEAVPEDVRSICDLGIGSGNFSLEVVQRIPSVEVYGIDLDGGALKIAKEKIPGATLYERDFFSEPLPKSDYIISSLATHHFSSEERLERLEQIARNGKGFVNFDMFLMNKNDLDKTVGLILEHVRKFHSDKESLDNVEYELRENDNIMSLDIQGDLFRKIGMEFEVLARDAPWAVYHAYWLSKNL